MRIYIRIVQSYESIVQTYKPIRQISQSIVQSLTLMFEG